MALVAKVLSRGQFEVDALGLENYADFAADAVGIFRNIVAQNGSAAGCGHHQRGKDPKERGFAAAVGAKKAEQLCGLHVQ